MPRIRMTKLYAGPLGSREPGTEHDVSKEEALALAKDNACVILDGEKRETAAAKASEQRGGNGKKDQESAKGKDASKDK